MVCLRGEARNMSGQSERSVSVPALFVRRHERRKPLETEATYGGDCKPALLLGILFVGAVTQQPLKDFMAAALTLARQTFSSLSSLRYRNRHGSAQPPYAATRRA
jgi:hypothetical protein